MNDILTDFKAGVTHITLNRPKARNALTPEMHHTLADIFDRFAADDTQHIAVITGAGEKAFCAGSDLKIGLGDVYPKTGYCGLSQRHDLYKPVIAAVNGFALGGGFELALACDLIIACDTASFGLPEPHVGAIALGGGLHRLPRQIGLKSAMGMILGAQPITASRAYTLGLVNDVCAPDALEATVQKWCNDILRGSPVAVRASKATALKGLSEPNLEAALTAQDEYPEFKFWRGSDDFKEGLGAFSEKRPPKWTGR